MKHLFCGCALAVMAGSVAGQAVAQDAPGAPPISSIEEVVVTARRTAENLQEVPVSVIALSQDALTENAIVSSADLGKVAPGLISVAGSGNPTLVDFSVRGRGLNFGAAAGSVETYFAEVPLSPPFQMPQLPPQFFDLASVQVLKGPQGTLFGRSTTGGAVLIQPQLPNDVFEGYVRGQFGNYRNGQLEGAVNIPLVEDKLAVRLAGFHWRRDGYVKLRSSLPADVTNRFSDPAYLTRLFGAGTTFANGRVVGSGGRVLVDNGVIIAGDTGLPVDATDYNNQDVTELRASIRLTPTDRIENTTVLTYHRDHNRGNTTGGLLVVRSGGVPVGTEPSPGSGTYDGYLSSPPVRPQNESYAAINTTTFDLTDSMTLKNIFGYIRSEGYVLDGYDPDGSVARTIDTYVGRAKTQEQLTNELQLQGRTFDDRLEFTLGGLVDKLIAPDDPSNLNTASVSGNSTTAPDPGHPNSQAFLTRYLSTNIDSYALYVAGTFNITDQLSITGGYRHTWDEVTGAQAVSLSQSIYQTPVFQDADPAVAGLQQSRQLQAKFESDVYNVGVDYKLTPDVLLYAGYRRGFKRGGFNSSAFGAFPPSFGPETIDNYSVGAKTQFEVAGMEVRFNLEGFYDDYKGFQASYLLLDPATFNLLTLTTNIPKVRYYGLDTDLTVRLTDWADLNVSYAYLKAEIREFPDVTTPNPANPSLEANDIPFAPENQLQAALRFHGEIANLGEWVVRPSVSFRDEFTTTLFNVQLPASQRALFGSFNNKALGGALVEDVTLVDLRGELNDIRGSNVSVAVGATNLLDEYYTLGNSGTLSFGIQGNSVGAPRMIYAEVNYRF